MQAVREVTQWAVEYRQPNHTYLLDGDKIIAYMKWSQGPAEYLRTPLKLDRRGRKFEQLKNNPFEIKTESTLIEFKGSKGNSYFVDPEAQTCTCPGFTFRGACKHVKELA